MPDVSAAPDFRGACPDPAIRSPQMAQTYADKAVELSPENPRYLATAALASLLADEDAAAAKVTLERVKATRGHWIDRDYFILAFAEHAGGQSDQADTALGEGVRWMEEHRPHSADSKLLRDFVESALENEGK